MIPRGHKTDPRRGRRWKFFGQSGLVVPAGFSNTNSLLFDGVDEYAKVASAAPLCFTPATAFTVALSFKTSSSEISLIGKRAADSSGWEIFISGNLIYFQIRNTSAQFFGRNSNAAVNDGAWHTLVVTYTGSGNIADMIFYIDGSVAATSVFGTQTAGTFTGTEDLRVGCRFPGSVQYQGKLDEISLWNAAQSASDAAAMSAGPSDLSLLSTYSSQAIAWWRFENNYNDEKGTYNLTGVNQEPGDFQGDVP